MSNLAVIWLLLGIGCLFMAFIELRQHAETARKASTKYCEEQGLQFISIHRAWWKLSWIGQQGPQFMSCYDVEFSSDGTNAYCGQVYMRNRKIDRVDFPAYTI